MICSLLNEIVNMQKERTSRKKAKTLSVSNDVNDYDDGYDHDDGYDDKYVDDCDDYDDNDGDCYDDDGYDGVHDDK